MVDTPVEILLITGPAGVGKSTLCWEMGDLLAAAGIAYAAIETDELDRVFPKPSAEDLAPLALGARDVSQLNLAALWGTYRALGHWRLLMSGVMLHVDFDRRWIRAAVPDAQITVVRLRAGNETLLARLDRREQGLVAMPRSSAACVRPAAWRAKLSTAISSSTRTGIRRPNLPASSSRGRAG